MLVVTTASQVPTDTLVHTTVLQVQTDVQVATIVSYVHCRCQVQAGFDDLDSDVVDLVNEHRDTSWVAQGLETPLLLTDFSSEIFETFSSLSLIRQVSDSRDFTVSSTYLVKSHL